MDVIMTLDDFNTQKNKVSMQRQMIGKYMLFFLDEDLKMKSHQHKPCKIFSSVFNIMSTVFINQSPTRPQIIDSRGGLF